MRAALYALIASIRSVFRHDADDREFKDEIESHIEMVVDAKMRRGMPREVALREARLEFGGASALADAHRDARGLPRIEVLIRDVRYAVRTLRRDAALATFAILIIGIGIGASVTIFGVVNALWLRPLPFADAARLVWIANGTSDNLSNQTVQSGHLVDLKMQSQSMSAIEAFSPFYGVGDIRLTGVGEPERVTGVPITEGFLPLLGITPQAGRFFAREECLWGAPPTAILSHAFWKRAFQADPGVVGRSIVLDGRPTRVVGVLPASFDFATVFSPGRPADFFVPLSLGPETNRRGNVLALIGRLRPGVGIDAAASETATTAERIIANAPEVEPGRRRNRFAPYLRPLQERITGGFYTTLAILAGAVGFLMLLVAANTSSLLLARASARRKEMAVRMALGAGRGHLVRQLLVEGLVLSVAGAILGLGLAVLGTGAIAGIQNVDVPLLQNVRVDAIAIIFTAAVAVITGVGLGIVPALQASGAAPIEAMNASSRGMTSDGWARRAIVVSEVALVCVLLVGAGLLARSLEKVLAVQPGFVADRLVSLRVDPSRTTLRSKEARNAYFEALLSEVRATPGVEAAALTDALPFGDNYGWRGWTVAAAERAADKSARRNGLVRMVDDRYFDAMQIPIKTGRGFSPDDRATSGLVVVISTGLAQALWPDQDPLHRFLRSSGRDYEVIGVVNPVTYFALERPTGNEMYMLLTQTGDYETVDLVVRAVGEPTDVIPSIQAALKRADPQLPSIEFLTMADLVDRSVFMRRFTVRLVGGFAAFGVILAMLGLFAVISYSVQQRRREIGIRMALGAEPAAVQQQVLVQALKLAGAGLAIGMPCAWLSAKAIGGVLFAVTSFDPMTYGGVVTVVAVVTFCAAMSPARRASRIDPLRALRLE